MNRDKYRKSWLRAHKRYEKRVYSIFKKVFKTEANKIPFDFLNASNLDEDLNKAISLSAFQNAYYDAYNEIGLIHGERIGKGINRDIKNFDVNTFYNAYTQGLFDWLIDNIGYRIISVREEFIKQIKKIIVNSFEQGLTTFEISKEIQKLVNRRDFYRWQALRIARTETTAIANRAASIAGSSSGIVLDKVWISALDKRVRVNPPDKYDHREMNGVKVAENEYFDVQGDLLEYPGAPITKNGTPSNGANVINCRCTVALVPKRDSNGMVIRR